MALYVDNKKVKVSEIKNYKGSDPVFSKMNEALTYFQNHFFARGDSLVFKWGPGMRTFNKKAKLKDGKKAILITSRHDVDTPEGRVAIVYSDKARLTVAGELENVGAGFWFRKSKVFGPDKVEQAIYMLCFVPACRNGQIVLEDVEKESVKVTDERRRMADLYYYLYNSSSPLVASHEQMITLAYAWNVAKPDKFYQNTLANKLYDAVVKADEKKVKGLMIEDFIEQVQEITPNTKVLALVRKAEGMGVLFYDEKSMTFILKDGEDKRKWKQVLQVPSGKGDKKYVELSKFLASNEKQRGMIETVMRFKSEEAPLVPEAKEEAAKEEEKKEELPEQKEPQLSNVRQVEIPEGYNEKYALARELGLTTQRKPTEVLDRLLKEYNERLASASVD